MAEALHGSSGLSRPAEAVREVRLAVIGDYGKGNDNAAAVADMVRNVLAPDLIFTVGDNNYGALSYRGYDAAAGRFYSAYIGDYEGFHGEGAETNAFYPALGNHDWNATVGYDAYLKFFTLPGNERYYEIRQGPVHFFIINSDSHEPDGIGSTSTQAAWLMDALSASTATWNFVFMHHAPYSSAKHGSQTQLQWPYGAWGADAVFAGHDHTYERLSVGGVPYFVNGLGGKSSYDFGPPLPETVFRYNDNHGAMLVETGEQFVTFEFWSIDNGGTLIDSVVFMASGGLAGDLDGNGSVGIIDRLILLGSWGLCPSPPIPCPADFDGDGAVGIIDLAILLRSSG